MCAARTTIPSVDAEASVFAPTWTNVMTNGVPRLAAGLGIGLFISSAIAAPGDGAPSCGEIATFVDGLSPTQELHVAPDGSNSSGDGSADDPFATIAFAAAHAVPGTAVRVHAGTYAGGGFITDKAGTAAAPIWIGGAPGEPRPVIVGGSEGLHFIRARYMIIHDLEVHSAANNGINCDDGGDYDDPLASHHLLFRDLYIHNIGGSGNQDGLKLSGINDFAVLDCEIAFCGGAMSGSGIDMVGCHHGLIARCYLHDLSAHAVQCKGGSEDVDIRWCRLTEAGERGINIGGSTGFEFFRPPLSPSMPNFEAKNIRVVANVIEGCTASVAYVGCVDSVVADNTVVDPHNWIIRILQETVSGGGFTFLPCGNNSFINNLVYFDRSDLSTYVNIGPNTAPATFTFAHSLWYAHDNPALSAPTLPVAETGAVIGENPLLANPAAGDYSIGADSPAAGAGLAPAFAAADIAATCYRVRPSIGAYEIPPPVGDLDGNGSVDLLDWCRLAACLGGPTVPLSDACTTADLDNDGDADLLDVVIVANAFGS